MQRPARAQQRERERGGDGARADRGRRAAPRVAQRQRGARLCRRPVPACPQGVRLPPPECLQGAASPGLARSRLRHARAIFPTWPGLLRPPPPACVVLRRICGATASCGVGAASTWMPRTCPSCRCDHCSGRAPRPLVLDLSPPHAPLSSAHRVASAGALVLSLQLAPVFSRSSRAGATPSCWRATGVPSCGGAAAPGSAGGKSGASATTRACRPTPAPP